MLNQFIVKCFILIEILPVPDFLILASEGCVLTSQELLSSFLLCHLREK